MSFEVSISDRVGRFALNASFSAPKGLTVLFGRSGSGKTMVINAIAGLRAPQDGHIRVGDRVLYDARAGINLPVHHRRVGVIFQDSRLFPHMSVRRNLLYGRRLRRAASVDVRLDQVVEMLGLEQLLDQAPMHLSGGEKQRVAIGRAVLRGPELILADEPLAALDERRKLEILPYFERMRDELGIPILYVSHSAAEVARLATTVVVMDRGSVQQVGRAEDVLADASVTPTGVRSVGAVITAQLIAHHDDGLSELNANGVTLLIPKVARPVGSGIRVRIAAHDVILSRGTPEKLSALNIIDGLIEATRMGEGPGCLVTLKTDAGRILARVTQRSVRSLGLKPGEQVSAVIKSVAIAPTDVG